MPVRKWLVTLFYLYASFSTAAQGSANSAANHHLPDSVVAVASEAYEPHSFLRRLFMGNNYRREWAQAVTVPVFYLSRSGLTIKELSGGKQTKSLQLTDSLGKPWALRTVSKEITDDGLSPALRNSLGKNLSQDFISAAFPFAVPLAGEIAFAAGINAARPGMFFVADDTALGKYRSIFSGKLCTLEERDPGFDSTINTNEVFTSLRQSNRSKVQQQVYLKARLVDMLLGDWDRHAGNWRFGVSDSSGFQIYHAIPRDRDWAFYNSKGWLPWLARVTRAMRYLTGFTKRMKNAKNLSWKSWAMDKQLLNELDATAWETTARTMQATLTNEAIDKAVQILPKEVYAIKGSYFAQRLKNRRDALVKEALKYYRFLVAEAIVTGSDEEERFAIHATGDSLRVTVHGGATAQLLYQRTFMASETYALTINGYGGNDVFTVTGDGNSPIRLVLNGGAGADIYTIQAGIRCKVMDEEADKNMALQQGKAKLDLK